MFRNAFAYITRKWSKSLLLLTIILLMSTLSLLGLAMRSATQEAASKSLGSITNSFSMQINRNTNPGTPRGAGNLKGEDIKKISETKGIVSTIKRINGIGDLLDYEIIEWNEKNFDINEPMPILDAAIGYTFLGNNIHIVKENNNNLKITTPEDYYILKAMLELEESKYVFGI